MQPRKTYTAYARAVEKLTREHFPIGSTNRIEDRFDTEKFKKGINQFKEQEEKYKVDESWKSYNKYELFAQCYTIADEYSSGNCEFQSTWAFAQYIKANVHPIYLIDIIENPHRMIILGDYINHPGLAVIHDPHGHEFYPYEEFALGGHHANRYGKTLQVYLTVDQTLTEKERSFFLKGQATLLTLNVPDEKSTAYQDELLRTKEYWEGRIIQLGKDGLKAFANQNWETAISMYEKAVTLAVNLYGENNWRLESIYYNLASTYYENNQLTESHYFLDQLNSMIIAKTDQIEKNTTFSESRIDALILTQCKCTYKSALVYLKQRNIEYALKLFQFCMQAAEVISNPEQAQKYKNLAQTQINQLTKQHVAASPSKAV